MAPVLTAALLAMSNEFANSRDDATDIFVPFSAHTYSSFPAATDINRVRQLRARSATDPVPWTQQEWVGIATVCLWIFCGASLIVLLWLWCNGIIDAWLNVSVSLSCSICWFNNV